PDGGRWLWRLRLPRRQGPALAGRRPLPRARRPRAQRPGHSRPDRAVRDLVRAGHGRPALALFPGNEMNDIDTSADQWWLASLGTTLVWARLRVRPAGTAEVLDSDGNTLSYDSEDTARAQLFDAEFVA